MASSPDIRRFAPGPRVYSQPAPGGWPHVRRDSLTWAGPRRLRVALVADIHACRPWMMPRRIAKIVAAVMAETPDLILLLGDYIGDHLVRAGNLRPDAWAAPLAGLSAPLGVHAILGNHDGWRYAPDGAPIKGSTLAQPALEAVGIPVYENSARRVDLGGGGGFWLAGLGSQSARPSNWAPWVGVDDLDVCLAGIDNDAPVILMAHEPDVFPHVPDRVFLTVSGHTHGGQIRFGGVAPVVPSRFRNRYAYGHVTETGPEGHLRHLIVSGGLGDSGLPIRLGVPPEIVLLTLQTEEGT